MLTTTQIHRARAYAAAKARARADAQLEALQNEARQTLKALFSLAWEKGTPADRALIAAHLKRVNWGDGDEVTRAIEWSWGSIVTLTYDEARTGAA